MHIVSFRGDLHELMGPIFWENYEEYNQQK